MTMTLLRYRTLESDHDYFAMVPTIWLSDLTQWLRLLDATIISTSHNYDGEAVLPINWPSYKTCMEHVKLSDLVAMAR